ncbi:unnamed protein product [Coregonus sp. 'balchen']|nr:unnamed protein product [Coregonus sp. 'balchen']
MEGSQIVVVQSNKASMIALPDKLINDLDLPAKLFESSGTPDIQTSFNAKQRGRGKVDTEVKTEDTVTTIKTAECEEIEKAPDETRPVYSISTFWNEMEKLTINDILRLRMVSDAQQSTVLPQPPESEAADTSDATDSGYFTHLDDSEPDRSSGDILMKNSLKIG